MIGLGAANIPQGDRRHQKARDYLTLELYSIGTGSTSEFTAFYELEDGSIDVPRDYGDLLGIAPNHIAYGFSNDEGVMQPITLRDEQVPFVNAIETAAKQVTEGDWSHVDIRAEAATGKGKTVMSLEVARLLGVTTLIIVDQEFLKNQWVDTLVDLFHVDPDEIGIVQGKQRDWGGKSFVIGMIQSMYDRDLPQDFYEYFGYCIFDEGHTVGAEQFSQVLLNIPASVRLSISATPERTDELETVLEANLGKVQVTLTAKHKESTVRYVEYDGSSYSWYANSSKKSGRYLSEIAAEPARNHMLAQVIKELYDTGRDVLGVGDRTAQLPAIKAILIQLGIPDEEIGIVAGNVGTFRYAKDDSPRRKPEGYHRGAPYTPIKIQYIEKRVPKPELERRKTECRIVLATYGMFEKGVDEPRLAAGVDLTPRSKARQLHGRILRKHKGKLVPIWTTVRDINSFRAEHQFAERLLEYERSNAEVYKWDLATGAKSHKPVDELVPEVRRRVRNLRGQRITTRPDGTFIVETKPTGRVPSKHLARRTARTTRSKATRSVAESC